MPRVARGGHRLLDGRSARRPLLPRLRLCRLLVAGLPIALINQRLRGPRSQCRVYLPMRQLSLLGRVFLFVCVSTVVYGFRIPTIMPTNLLVA